ncbi:MAG: PHP domain-containing protein [Anaerolineales bacterium]|nr:PHP domain-containing protein [Anaerolineales bacterium]
MGTTTGSCGTGRSASSWRASWVRSQNQTEVCIDTPLRIEHFVGHEQEGQYLTIPFRMPPDIESFTLAYHYARHRTTADGDEGTGFTTRQEVNIIDLGLVAPDGVQVGASGSSKTEIQVGKTFATPGYRPFPLVPGEWRILLGAYKVAPQGVTVVYELTFSPKRMRLFKGDLHAHTLASDGVLAVDELARHALRHGLDFLAITDHNQPVSADSLPRLPGLTLIPGVEWTHYRGHANFLGVDQPYDEPFFANNLEEVRARFASAHRRGALISLNHPFDEQCPFLFDWSELPFDCLEIWNGPMRESNLRAVGLWQSLLSAGRKLPICGGSDYHRSQLFLFPGGPTTCVYAPSADPADILSGLRQGHAYVTFAPDGPVLEATAEEALLGDSVPFPGVREMQVKVEGLLAGDIVQVVTGSSSTPLLQADASGSFQGQYVMEAPGFARIEILRQFIPGLPNLPALIANPIYFDAS